MGGKGTRWLAGLAGVIAALGAIASGAGVFLRGDLATVPFTTVRGEVVDSLVGGVYRFNGLTIASEGVGWDVVTLVLVVPALLLTVPGLWRGSLRAALVATGLLAYFAYQYLEYATFLAYGPLFLVYVAIFALSLSGIALLVSTIDLAGLPAHFSPRFPRRAVIGFGLFMAVLLAGMWLPLIARTLSLETVEDLAGGTTLVVQAFDLGVLVPLGLFTGAAVHRRLPIGFVLACVIVVKGVAMGSAIAAMLVFEGMATGATQVAPIVGFALIALASLAIAVRVFGSLDRPPEAAAAGRGLGFARGG
jgi:hypothetical protein